MNSGDKMPRHARTKSKTGVYHVILRGSNKQEIFHEDEDCRHFLDTLLNLKRKSGIHVYGWCLMGNHVHLLLKEGQEDISVTMKRMGVSYAAYYNWKYETTGHLFQDRFKSENVESERYLRTVIRYIHHNPVKAGMVSRVDGWVWSSYLGYFGGSVYPNNLLDSDVILAVFAPNISIAREFFHAFHLSNHHEDDDCLDDTAYMKKRLTDDEARTEMMTLLGETHLTHIKSLPKLERDRLLRKIKQIDGLTQRQAARLLGVSQKVIFKA